MTSTRVQTDEEIQRCIKQMKDIYDHFMAFINNPDISADEDFINLIQNIDKHGIRGKKELFNHFICLLVDISNNHHRQTGFFKKIEQIIHNFQDTIKKVNTNIEIYKQFESNKRLLYFLIHEQILIFNDEIYQLITMNGPQILDYFLPETMKSDSNRFSNDESFRYYFDHLDEYESKRQTGENDSQICSLIRKDSCEEFIEYINQMKISPTSKIKPSIFETNQFLIGKSPTLIEYAAFFGSIRIIQYLYSNHVEVDGSLWLYGIHSNNFELIQKFILRKCIKPIDKTFKEVLIESIKCHHNDIAKYVDNNLVTNERAANKKIDFNELILNNAFKYHNYSFITTDIGQRDAFYYFSKYNYRNIVDYLIKSQKVYIESKIIEIVYLDGIHFLQFNKIFKDK